ncbi:MAG: mechanosensitive ion channel family protein [Candidatus Binatia bacterium]
MAEFFGLGPEEQKLLVMILAAPVSLLVTLGIYLWVRRLLRAWAKRTATPVDDQIVALTEHSLLPIMVLGVVYLLFSFIPLPMGFADIGKKVSLASMIVLALVLGARVSFLFLERLGERYELAQILAQRERGPIWAVLSAILCYTLLIHFLAPSEPARLVLQPVVRIIMILAFAWLLVRGVASGTDMVQKSYGERLKGIDATRARSFETVVGILRYVANFAVGLIAIGAALNQFEFFQTLATSFLASAGIAGLVIGLAAQRTLGNLFAGVQLALTQPVRIGDSVVFEGEWGWIEEISLTYVVIRIWDLRRLVVPINYLLDRPIQNWTKASPDLIGTVYIYTDYRIDVEAVRQELGRILESTPLWNRKVPPILQVTDCKQDTVELRALCSSSDASVGWDLRCLVREKLLGYIQEIENGQFLPRTRVELERQVMESRQGTASTS